MEQNRNPRFDSPSEAVAGTQPSLASPSLPAPANAADIGPLISECLSDTFVEGGRKPRHDGWTPERIGDFLLHLAGSATVEAAAHAVGLSVAAAYAFRNRRQGRAFAKMWDAVLIHRSRARMAAENSSRAVNGVVSKRVRDGVVVEELHHHDNRLAMAMLTRLDRLAEREAPNEEHLRALSEDLDDYIECVEKGGDEDAFVEARKPAPAPAPIAVVRPGIPDRDEFDRLASLTGSPSWRDVPSMDIPVADLDYDERESWTDDQWIRAQRSGLLAWTDMRMEAEAGLQPIAPATAAFMRSRAWATIRHAPAQAGEAAVDVEDLHPHGMAEWNDEQWERAERSGLLRRLPEEAWVELSGPAQEPGAKGPCQPSTSSTFPGEEDG